MAGEGILVVDDNATNVKLVAFLLTARGYQVRTAACADEALREVATRCPRLILMDLQLPGMDGLELTRKLRTDPAMNGVVIVAVTAYAMSGDRARALEAGCDGFIAKPIDTRAFPGTVADYLANSRRTGDAG
jgi:two-component system, cell cycle response regulator DivK